MFIVFISSISMCYVAGSSRYCQKRKSTSILSRQNCHCLFTCLFSPWASSSERAETGSDSSLRQDTQLKIPPRVEVQCICWYQTSAQTLVLKGSSISPTPKVTFPLERSPGWPSGKWGTACPFSVFILPSTWLIHSRFCRVGLRVWMIPVITGTLSFDPGESTGASSRWKPKVLMHR